MFDLACAVHACKIFQVWLFQIVYWIRREFWSIFDFTIISIGVFTMACYRMSMSHWICPVSHVRVYVNICPTWLYTIVLYAATILSHCCADMSRDIFHFDISLCFCIIQICCWFHLYAREAGICLFYWCPVFFMCANNKIHFRSMVVFVCLHFTLPHYHNYANVSECIDLLK